MASYFLLNKKVLRFSEVYHREKDSIGKRVNEDKAEVDLVPVFENKESKSFVENILESGNTQMKMELDIEITLPASPLAPQGTGILQVETFGRDHILYKIFERTNRRITMEFQVTGFGAVCSSPSTGNGTATSSAHSWKIEGMECVWSQRFTTSTFSIEPVYSALGMIKGIPVATMNDWKERKPFTGEFTVFIRISESPFMRQVGLEHQQTLKCRKILKKKVSTDVDLVAKCGSISKCHKAFLVVHSKIFAEIFKQRENSPKLDLSYHLSKKCTEALLNYMYHKDLSEIYKSVEFALECLKGAIEFQIVDLIPEVQKYLATKPSNEFSADQGIKLYVIVKSAPIIDISFWTSEEDERMDEGSVHEDEENRGRSEDSLEILSDDDNENSSSSHSNASEQGVKRPMNQEKNDLGKRFRSDYYHRTGKNMAVLRQDSAASINGHGSRTVVQPDDDDDGDENVLSDVDEDENDSTDEENEEDTAKYLGLIEQQAKQIILWYLHNDNTRLLQSVEYDSLRQKPNLLMEILKMIIQNRCL